MYRNWPGEVAPNLILVDKPTGMTSFDVIRRLRKYTGVRKFGYAGTLDPAASGLLLLGVEQGTKQLAHYLQQDKIYEAEILLGQSRTTDDMDGAVVVDEPTCLVNATAVEEQVQALVGTQTLPVSAYSAIKRNGVPMYKHARKAAAAGESVSVVPKRSMKVYQAEYHSLKKVTIHQAEYTVVHVTFSVAAGTYIRSLAVALGDALGCPATLFSLRRTKIGDFTITQSASLDAYKTMT